MIINYVISEKRCERFETFATFGNQKAAFDCCKEVFSIKISYSTFKRKLNKNKKFESEKVKVETFERFTNFKNFKNSKNGQFKHQNRAYNQASRENKA